jgi:hypothetical protein
LHALRVSLILGEMKITLSLDDDVVRQVRKIAAERGATLTELLRQYLKTLAAENAEPGRKQRELEALDGPSRDSSSRSGSEPGPEPISMNAPEFLDSDKKCVPLAAAISHFRRDFRPPDVYSLRPENFLLPWVRGNCLDKANEGAGRGPNRRTGIRNRRNSMETKTGDPS